jgi:hypothetical protein
VKPSVERHVRAAGSSTSQQPASASMSFPWLPGLRNRQFQFVGSTNPDTGVPSPEASTRQAYYQGTGSVKPVAARVVSATNANAENPSPYNPVAYSGKYKFLNIPEQQLKFLPILLRLYSILYVIIKDNRTITFRHAQIELLKQTTSY